MEQKIRKLGISFAIGLLFSIQALAADLTISAAASLTNAFKEMAPIFESQNPGVKVRLNFAASGQLLQQIVKGAPADVFASADQETMNQAQQQGFVKADARKNFVSNTLVVIVPKSVKKMPTGLSDLTKAQYQKLAIGLPASVPVGRYTKAVLEKKNLWGLIQPKMIGAQSVRQALDYVARDEVDAGFVYSTDAAIMPDKVSVAFVVPTETPILYPIAPLSNSSQYDLAQKFISFVGSTKGQEILAKYGFGKP
jgi:molybdate transport system substrate-binding protein